MNENNHQKKCNCVACKMRIKLYNTFTRIFDEYKEEFIKENQRLPIGTLMFETLQWLVYTLKNQEEPLTNEEIIYNITEMSFSILKKKEK